MKPFLFANFECLVCSVLTFKCVWKKEIRWISCQKTLEVFKQVKNPAHKSTFCLLIVLLFHSLSKWIQLASQNCNISYSTCIQSKLICNSKSFWKHLQFPAVSCIPKTYENIVWDFLLWLFWTLGYQLWKV